ncbi:MAG: PhoH family protein [bacterium]
MARKKNAKRKQFEDEIFNESEYNDDLDYKKSDFVSKTNSLPDVKIVAKNESQKNLIRSIKNNEITICYGSPGTGKTYVSLGLALNNLKKVSNEYDRIYLVKSVRTLQDEDVGYLKGDLNSKIEPVMQSFFLNIKKLIPTKIMNNLINDDILVPFPVAYMRGVTLDNCIIVVDEVQNLTLTNIKTIMTRIGTNCKLIILGDLNQIDLPNSNYSALAPIIKMFELHEQIGVIEMSKDDINVRNPLIKSIEDKFDEYEKNNKTTNKQVKQLLV